MTDPLEACLQELNEAVRNQNEAKLLCRSKGECSLCKALCEKEDALRHKYNALVIAYTKEDEK